MSTTSGIRAEKPELTGQRILLVEDEYFIADDLCRALEERGATIVGPVPSLANAMSLAASEDLTCAVLDINLRGESGFKVAEILHQRNVPFIYTTGYESSLIPEDLKGAMHIGKPFRVDELLLAVAAVARRPQAKT